jgi:hypothetical protein
MGALTGERSAEVSSDSGLGRIGLEVSRDDKIVPTAVLRDTFLGKMRKED